MWGEELRGWPGWSNLSLATATVLLFGLANILAMPNASATGLVDLALETSGEIHAAESEMSAGTGACFNTLESSRHKAREERMFGGISHLRLLKSMESETANQIGLIENQAARWRAEQGAV